MITMLRLVFSCLVASMLVACTVKTDPNPGPGPADPNPPVPPQKPTQVEDIKKIYSGSSYPTSEYFNFVLAPSGALKENVRWFRLPQGASSILKIYGSSFATISTNGSVCSSQTFQLKKQLVTFDSKGMISSETEINDWNEGVFAIDPQADNLLRMTFTGNFVNCEGGSASFYVQTPSVEVAKIQMDLGVFSQSSSSNSQEVKVEGNYPQLILTPDGAKPLQLYCFNSKCVGRDGTGVLWRLALHSKTSFSLLSESNTSTNYEYLHGLSPRPISLTAPLLTVLDGMWLGKMQVDSSGGTKNVPLSLKVSSYKFEDGTGISFDMTFEGKPNVFSGGLGGRVGKNGTVTRNCVFNDVVIGSFYGGDLFQVGVLDNYCKNDDNKFFSVERLSNGHLRLKAYDGSKYYSSELTAW